MESAEESFSESEDDDTNPDQTRKRHLDKRYDISREHGYHGSCSGIINELLRYANNFADGENGAIFIPTSRYETFRQDYHIRKILIRDEDVWDFDLKRGKKIKFMKLIWTKKDQIRTYIPSSTSYLTAFSFLQPQFLHYLDKPFTNIGATMTQVNLVLDYHRTQKRAKGIEILSLFDLVAFKMAIDDNRLDYCNCEFHKIIERTLRQTVESKKYKKVNNFDLIAYLNDHQEFRREQVFVDYLVYHFQDTIGSVYFNGIDPYSIKLSSITNVPEFLKISNNPNTFTISVIDAGGECSEVLYEILMKAEQRKEFEFDLDVEWVYGGFDLVTKTSKPNSTHYISIKTKNSANFIENFINWLKLAFGEHSTCFDLDIDCDNFESIEPFVFSGLHINTLKFCYVTLDYELIKMLNRCRYKQLVFEDCRIQNEYDERYDFIGLGPVGNGQNIFKFLDELPNVKQTRLILEEHTIGTLLTFVIAYMLGNQVNDFNLYFQLRLRQWNRKRKEVLVSRFIRLRSGTDFDAIEACTLSGERIDLYEAINKINPSVREDFDFYN